MKKIALIGTIASVVFVGTNAWAEEDCVWSQSETGNNYGIYSGYAKTLTKSCWTDDTHTKKIEETIHIEGPKYTITIPDNNELPVISDGTSTYTIDNVPRLATSSYAITFDEQGRVSTLSSKWLDYNNNMYDHNAREATFFNVTDYSYNDGSVTSYTKSYNEDNLLTAEKTVIYSGAFCVTERGVRCGYTSKTIENKSYTYDSNGKLSAIYVNGELVESYSYDKNGSYTVSDSAGHILGKYNADGSVFLPKRIYTPSEATAAVSKKGKNTFSIRYR